MLKYIEQDQLRSLAGSIQARSEDALEFGKSTVGSLSQQCQSIKSPDLSAPMHFFGSFRALLFLALSLVSWLITGALKYRMDWRHPTRLTFGAWFAQLAVNLTVSGLFLVLRRFGTSLSLVSAILAVIGGLLLLTARVSRFAAWLIVRR
jgi:tryptophan-rich sensory protein